jgi:hypothetical protein
MKGMNAETMGRVIAEMVESMGDGVIMLQFDYSRFDAHVRKQMLRLCVQIYKIFLILDAKLAAHFRLVMLAYVDFTVVWRKNKEGKWTAHVSCRATGDLDTSTGNILVCCLIIITYLLDWKRRHKRRPPKLGWCHRW